MSLILDYLSLDGLSTLINNIKSKYALKTEIPKSLPANGGNADTLDNYHATGLFTNLSNSGNNISISVGGTTKTLTPAYATRAGSVTDDKILWGGSSITGGFSPVDAGISGILGADRLAFISSEAVTIEYSRDGGVTWLDYEATDTQKKALFMPGGNANLIIGKPSNIEEVLPGNQLRITINCQNYSVYTILNKHVVFISTNTSSGATLTIQKSTIGNPSVFTDISTDVAISGWSGYNVINHDSFFAGGYNDYQTKFIRYIFKHRTAENPTNTYKGLLVRNIMAFGGVGWSTPSNMAEYNSLFKWDVDQNAVFPAKVTATSFKGSLDGKLVTPRTIWGKSFDGSANISGDMTNVHHIYHNGYFIYTGVTGKNINTIDYYDGGAATFGYGQAVNGIDTYLEGENVHIKTTSTHKEIISVTNSGNVGINTTSPKEKLHVKGNAQFGEETEVNSGATVKIRDSKEFLLSLYRTGVEGWTHIVNSNGCYQIKNNSYNYYPITFTTGTTGRVGIMTASPVTTFDVNGGIHFSADLSMDNQSTFTAKNASGTAENFLWPRWSDNKTYLNYGSAGFLIRNNSNVNTMFMDNNNKVGIGTTNPIYKLDVNGTLGVADDVTFSKAATIKGKLDTIGNITITNTNPKLTLSTGRLISSISCISNGKLNISSSGVFIDNNTEVDGSLLLWDTLEAFGDIQCSGGISCESYITAYAQNTTSDANLKDITKDFNITIEQIANAPSVEFKWKSNGNISVGSIAQYWKDICPQAVHEINDHLTMQYDVIALLSSISNAKELLEKDKEIQSLKEEINDLKKCINNINNKLKLLNS